MNSTLSNHEITQRFYGSRQVHTPLDNPAKFGEQQLEQYRQLGFVAIENVFSPSEVEGAKQSLQRLTTAGDLGCQIGYEPGAEVEKMDEQERATYVRKLFFFTEHDRHLKAMATEEVLVSIVRRLAEEDVRLIQDMALLKQAYVGTEKPWHQDTAYFLVEPMEKVIGTWTALDSATAENGCMHVVPGSHLKGPRPHFHSRDCQLPDDDERADTSVVVPLKPGGVLFFSGLLHHGTPPNNSPSSRWALQYHYAGVSCRSISRDEQGQHFRVVEGYAGCLNPRHWPGPDTQKV